MNTAAKRREPPKQRLILPGDRIRLTAKGQEISGRPMEGTVISAHGYDLYVKVDDRVYLEKWAHEYWRRIRPNKQKASLAKQESE